MSLLNEADAIPAAVSALCAFLAMRKSGIDEDEAISLFTPLGLHPEASSSDANAERMRRLLNEAARLGLIRRDQRTILLVDSVPNPSDKAIDFRCYVRRRILEGDDDLLQILAWLVRWRVETQGSVTWSKVDASLLRQLGNVALNDVRWANMGRWAVWLGLAWRDGHGLVPDATGAISDDVLPTLVEGSTTSIWDFVERVDNAIPLPGGWRHTVGKQGNGRDELAPALVLALLRLEQAGRVGLLLKSDARHSLRLPDRSGQRTVTHLVTHIGAKS